MDVADRQIARPASDNPRQRPPMIPDSFEVIQIGK